LGAELTGVAAREAARRTCVHVWTVVEGHVSRFVCSKPGCGVFGFIRNAFSWSQANRGNRPPRNVIVLKCKSCKRLPATVVVWAGTTERFRCETCATDGDRDADGLPALTDPQWKMIASAVDYGDPTAHLRGRSAHGGATSTADKLIRLGLLDKDLRPTAKGREALAAARKKRKVA
jgi:hypothetical protein